MPAAIDIMRWTGASGSPTKTAITGINTRANAIDAHSTNDTANPVQIPVSGNNYSFWVTTRLSCGATLPTTQVTNLRWYTDGANNFSGNGSVTCLGQNVLAAGAYTQATGSNGVTGNQLTTSSYPALTGAPVDVFATWGSGTPKTLGGTLLAAGPAGDFGDYMVYQLIVANNAVPGATGTETFTWKYDES